jgi:hypothetical protein
MHIPPNALTAPEFLKELLMALGQHLCNRELFISRMMPLQLLRRELPSSKFAPPPDFFQATIYRVFLSAAEFSAAITPAMS